MSRPTRRKPQSAAPSAPTARVTITGEPESTTPALCAMVEAALLPSVSAEITPRPRRAGHDVLLKSTRGRTLVFISDGATPADAVAQACFGLEVRP